MTHRFLSALAVLGVVACSHAPTPAAPAPAPAAAPVPTTAPKAAPPSGLSEAPRNWQLLDEAADHVPGISLQRAERELLKGRVPKATVVVAVIDGGIDTAHVDLAANLWTPPTAPADGHPNERHGWNFIGGPDGRSVHYDTYELTRIVVRCQHHESLPDALSARCTSLTADLDQRRTNTEEQVRRVREVGDALAKATGVLKQALGKDALSEDQVKALRPTDSTTARSQQLFLALASHGATSVAIHDALTELQARLDFELNPAFNPRPIVGDNYTDVHESRYGNFDVMGPDAKHGTHVSGIIGAVRGNGIGIDGIAPAVRVMMIRAVPDGDERDKDIANAIRFAVDHGARVINMSFGKGFSPEKPAVDDAVRYADAHDVLMVHAAGNDGQDLSTAANFPTPVFAGGATARNWIEVGASSWAGGDSLAASFSNYSHDKVDVFAPGVDITSTVPGNAYEKDSGTSMAAPVVTGLAAFLLAYYPEMTAADLKQVITQSVTRYDQLVVRPGSTNGERVPFSSLSKTGGIVNAYRALKTLQDFVP